jgi:hypothetical protein
MQSKLPAETFARAIKNKRLAGPPLFRLANHAIALAGFHVYQPAGRFHSRFDVIIRVIFAGGLVTALETANLCTRNPKHSRDLLFIS